jgi:hypothetical protein
MAVYIVLGVTWRASATYWDAGLAMGHRFIEAFTRSSCSAKRLDGAGAGTGKLIVKVVPRLATLSTPVVPLSPNDS